MADLAGNIRLVVGEIPFAIGDFGHVAPAYPVAPESLGIGRLGVVMVRARVDGVDGLRDFPDDVGRHGRTLKEPVSLPIKSGAVGCVALAQVDLAAISSGLQRGPMVDGSMAINAFDGGRSAWFAIQQTVPMNVGLEMAIGALHSVLEMRVLQMDGLGEFQRVVVGNDLVVQVAQVSLAVMFEDRPINPAVPMVIGELRVL